ncbi:hypothetical protein RDV89_16810 [Nocardioides zeae]|uniref:Uncharacterized protein n=1 Tax=Nocardioides imazamoxiresistens TaxID=3231893 RepID=A0ABU3Q155_9ACTN|nr:hypothetical protein [Nocardioides zeae]MDT9594750.1 hypothetical protein [Nocardioides zeae]
MARAPDQVSAGSVARTMDPLSTRTRTSPFPPDAAAWLAGTSGRTVVLAGDPRTTAPLAEALAALGYDVRSSVDGSMSLPDRSVDAIVAIDHAPELEVAARVLRPGGQVAILTQEHDARIPWVRKLGAALRLPAAGDPTAPLAECPYFGHVGSETFKHWEVVTRDALAEVVRSLPAVIERGSSEQERAVTAAVELYDDYGRGPDGMQLPWISHCHRAPVLAEAWATVTERSRAAVEAAEAADAAARAAVVPTSGPVSDPVDPAEPDAAATGDEEPEGAHEAPAPPPRPAFDIGDTAEGIITYVVDTGELPPVRAPLRDSADEPTQAMPAVRPGRPDRPGRPGRPAAPPPEDEGPDDPDLLIRFR